MSSQDPGHEPANNLQNNTEGIVLIPPPPPVQQSPQYYVRFAVRGETIGPVTDLAVRNMIQNRHLGITDLICEVGDTRWVVISESKFSGLVIAATSRSQMQSATCPNCQAQMAVVLKRSSFGTILIWIGIFTSIALIGLPLIIIGVILRGKRKASYICPRCNYST